jgi:molybdate-binding protein/DNA-binding XRE family transcriptional regulator
MLAIYRTIMSQNSRAEPASNIENRLRSLRLAKSLSQSSLADMAGITRQAVCAIEANQYLPTTAVALRLAGALDCRVEDLFSLVASGDVIEGDLLTEKSESRTDWARVRVKVAKVGGRTIVRPVAGLGDVLNYTVPADGLILGLVSGSGRTGKLPGRVRVQLLRDRRVIEQEIAVAGCDPAIFLAGEYLRRRRDTSAVVGWTLGSAAAIDALKRGEVHLAGLHVVDPKSGESNLPYLRKHLAGSGFTIVTFATWEEGLLVQPGNPKHIRSVADLVRKGILLVNREEGSGARSLLDQKLSEAGMSAHQLINGYERIVGSHLEIARFVATGQADVGVGVRSVARLLGLDFLPLQEARYDLVVPTAYLTDHPCLAPFMDTIVSRQFRSEVEALGGYDMRDTGKLQTL